jgi:TonB family protein
MDSRFRGNDILSSKIQIEAQPKFKHLRVRFGIVFQNSDSMRHILVLSAAFLLSVSTRAFAQSIPNPSQDVFVDVSEEPHETVPIEMLIVYPDSARRIGLEGTVKLQALIGKDGRVEKVEVLKSDNDIFKNAAIDAMKRETFTPAKQNGTPLKLWIVRQISFKLNRAEPHLDTVWKK